MWGDTSEIGVQGSTRDRSWSFRTVEALWDIQWEFQTKHWEPRVMLRLEIRDARFSKYMSDKHRHSFYYNYISYKASRDEPLFEYKYSSDFTGDIRRLMWSIVKPSNWVDSVSYLVCVLEKSHCQMSCVLSPTDPFRWEKARAGA